MPGFLLKGGSVPVTAGVQFRLVFPCGHWLTSIVRVGFHLPAHHRLSIGSEQLGVGGHRHVSVSPPSWLFADADPPGISTNPLGVPGQPAFPEHTGHLLSFAYVLCFQRLSLYLSTGSLLVAACCLGEELRGSQTPLRSHSHLCRWQREAGRGSTQG